MPSPIRLLWLIAGLLALALGMIGLVVPLLPTTPFVLLAAYCFSQGSERFERWLLGHPRLGPLVLDWREHHAVPLRAKQMAWVMMAASSVFVGLKLPLAWCWLPAAICAAAAWWLWRLPTRHPMPRDGT
jgi:uncharacterized membrane protein YbaN (DUF454 family)